MPATPIWCRRNSAKPSHSSSSSPTYNFLKMTITHLDFAELAKADDKGYGLQSLVVAIGRRLGMRVEAGGRGADKGRDVCFLTQTEVVHGLHIPSKILVSCKDRTESGKQLKVNDLEGSHLRVKEHGCNAFLLVTTIAPTDDLVTHIQSVAKNDGFSATIWQPDDIKDILLNGQNDKFRFTIARFFPNSSRTGDTNQHAFDYFAESLTRMDKEDSLELSLEFFDGVDDVLLAWGCLEKLIERDDIVLEDDLQKHYCKALSLNNDELKEAIFLDHHLEERLTEWVSYEDEIDWDDVELNKLELKNETTIELTVLASEPVHRMGEMFDVGLTATIEWTERGFSLVEYINDWDKAGELDWEIDQAMKAEKGRE